MTSLEGSTPCLDKHFCSYTIPTRIDYGLMIQKEKLAT
jgi:hypothetical protein